MKLLKWAMGVAALAGVGVLLAWAFIESREELARERLRDLPVKEPPRVSRAGGDIVLTLDRETQVRIGLKAQPLAGVALNPEVVAYGRLEEDPAESFTLRAPVAGTLRRPAADAWPRLGDRLQQGRVIGAIDPRLSPVDRVDLAARRLTAQADASAAGALLEAARASYERYKRLNAEGKNVADKVLQASEADVKVQEARWKAATETVRLIEESLAAAEAPAGQAGPILLTAASEGEVIDILAKPGEAIESGQAILRVARFDRLLARVDIPAGQTIQGPASGARIVPLGYADRPLHGRRVMTGPAVDPKTQGQAFVFQVACEGLHLRPGLAVTAYIALPGEPEKGVVVPRAAVVQLAGRDWVYVRISEEQFSRQMIATTRPAGDGWFVSAGLAPGNQVVVSGAQTLLSEELKSQIQIGEEAERKD